MKILYSLLIIICLVSCRCQCAKKSERFHSQYGQDQFVYEVFFQGKSDGVFVDIGAFDGISLSNSYFFEKELGWKGVCVEPQPKAFSKMAKIRDCILVKGCIADKKQEQDFLQLKGHDMLSGLVGAFDPRHLERIHREVASVRGKETVIRVPCFRLDEVLAENGIDHIDFLSLDTEGGELSILRTIDFNRTPVHVITVENNYDDLELPQFLESKGFSLMIELGCDQVYAHRSVLPTSCA